MLDAYDACSVMCTEEEEEEEQTTPSSPSASGDEDEGTGFRMDREGSGITPLPRGPMSDSGTSSRIWPRTQRLPDRHAHSLTFLRIRRLRTCWTRRTSGEKRHRCCIS